MLVGEAARVFDPAEFAMANLDLPLFNADVEQVGIPENVQVLADQITAADAVVISTPEYNKSISGVLKNALDWVSRTSGKPWAGKPVAIMSAAAGRSGGERAQFALRLCMVPFRADLVPGPELMIASSRSAFDGDGRLENERSQKTLGDLMQELKARIG